jgi:hypothetical protein
VRIGRTRIHYDGIGGNVGDGLGGNGHGDDGLGMMLPPATICNSFTVNSLNAFSCAALDIWISYRGYVTE